MRAAVLPLLALELDENGNPTGRRLVNDVDLVTAGEALNTVPLPERGNGNQMPQAFRGPDASAQMTHIVGSGSPNATDQVGSANESFQRIFLANQGA